MLIAPLKTRAFCTDCGSVLVDGSCPSRCDSPPATHSSSHAPASRLGRSRSRGRLWTSVNVVALAIALTVAGVALIRTSEASSRSTRIATAVDDSRHRVADLEQRVANGQERIDDLVTAQQSADARVTAIEARFRNAPKASATIGRAAKSVFTVITEHGTGSGWVARTNGDGADLVTNFHVISETYVNGGRTVKVKRGALTYTGHISVVSESDDLALISVDESIPRLSVAPERPAIGDPLLVLGSPLGLGGTVTSGIVSAFRKEAGVTVLQFSAPISPGNSGGPVIDEHGHVVGVAVSKMVGEGAEGIGFAVPIDRLCAGLKVC